MIKLTLFATAVLAVLAAIVYATINLDFNIGIEDKIYYSNETIDVNISVINRDSFTAKDAILTLYIEQRTFKFNLGDLKSYDTFTKTITLPEFPPSTHNIGGVLNYSSIFDERFVLETYGSFEVRFPEIQRFPRNVNIVKFEVPEKIYGGKEYEAKVTISNDGDVKGELEIELAFMDETTSERITLESGESKTLSIIPKFSNTGVSVIEARVYAIVDGIRYLLVYKGQEVFVQEEKTAKMALGRVEIVGKNGVKQNDEANLKVYLQNMGSYGASGVEGSLVSSDENIEITDGNVVYTLVSSGEITAPTEDTFKVRTKNANVGQYNLELEVKYTDSQQRTASFEIPLSVSEDTCQKDTDCGETTSCVDNKCVEVECSCGFVKNRECVPYECCSNSQCGELQSCNFELNRCVEKSGCIQITNNGASSDKADILFIGAEYPDSKELKDTIYELLGLAGNSKHLGLFSVEPFKSNKNKFNIWMIKAPEYTAPGGGICSTSCGTAVDFNNDAKYISQCPNADTTITIFKESAFRSCAGGGQWSSLSCQDASDRGKLILHETGHSFGGLADEYVEPSQGSRPWGPNCADTLNDAQAKWGDIAGTGGVEYFAGCSYTEDNFRPTKNSLMRSHYIADSYGPVNERAILEKLRRYK